MQTDLFDQPTISVHKSENNPVMQSYRNENEAHLTKQCQKVYNLLKAGERLTVKGAMNDHMIYSLPRRCLDLEQSLKIKINRERTGRIVTYYL